MRTRPTSALRLIASWLVLALAGCNTSANPAASGATPTASPAPIAATEHWAAPPDAMQLTVDAGLVPEKAEYLAFHVHAHLDVFIDGRPVIVPAGIGINIEDPDVIRFDDPGDISYGLEGCAQPCISPLHTHHASGIIHTESATPKPNTLGQFFVEWAVELSETCVGEFCEPETPIAIYVNGVEYAGDPDTIELADRTQIAIVIGTPPASIPSTADFTKP